MSQTEAQGTQILQEVLEKFSKGLKYQGNHRSQLSTRAAVLRAMILVLGINREEFDRIVYEVEKKIGKPLKFTNMGYSGLPSLGWIFQNEGEDPFDI